VVPEPKLKEAHYRYSASSGNLEQTGRASASRSDEKLDMDRQVMIASCIVYIPADACVGTGVALPSAPHS